jgi:Fur family transcriptional regulator, ferric uptake regulator
MKQTPGESIEQIRELIREAGLRATLGRIAVLSVLVAAKGPLTHAEVYERVGDQGADASTIFRALNDMSTAGLLRRMELGDHSWRYELLVKHQPDDGPHAHFLCIGCGEIFCLEPVDVRSQLVREKAVSSVTEVLLKGHCVACG